MKMAKIGLSKGSGKRLKVREKSVKSQGILKWILSGNPDGASQTLHVQGLSQKFVETAYFGRFLNVIQNKLL